MILNSITLPECPHTPALEQPRKPTDAALPIKNQSQIDPGHRQLPLQLRRRIKHRNWDLA